MSSGKFIRVTASSYQNRVLLGQDQHGRVVEAWDFSNWGQSFKDLLEHFRPQSEITAPMMRTHFNTPLPMGQAEPLSQTVLQSIDRADPAGRAKLLDDIARRTTGDPVPGSTGKTINMESGVQGLIGVMNKTEHAIPGVGMIMGVLKRVGLDFGPVQSMMVKGIADLQNRPVMFKFGDFLDQVASDPQFLTKNGWQIIDQGALENSIDAASKRLVSLYPGVQAAQKASMWVKSIGMAGVAAIVALSQINGANNPYSNNPASVDQSQQSMNRNQVQGTNPSQGFQNSAPQSAPYMPNGFSNLPPNANPKPQSWSNTDDLSDWGNYVKSSSQSRVVEAQVGGNPYPNAEQITNYLVEALGPSQGGDPQVLQSVISHLQTIYQEGQQFMAGMQQQQATQPAQAPQGVV